MTPKQLQQLRDADAFCWWDERAAILEYDAKMDRHRAEHQAYLLCCSAFGLSIVHEQTELELGKVRK